MNSQLASRVETLEREKKELESEKKELVSEKKELEARPRKTAARELHLMAHAACREGRILRTVMQEEDSNRTDTCFEDSAAGVHCHHINIFQDMDANLRVRVRNSRRLSVDGKEKIL